MKKLMIVMLLAGVLMTGCRTFPPVQSIEHQTVPTQDIKEVETAIVTGGMRSHHWQISKVSEGVMVGTFTIRTHKAVVDILYGPNEYSIVYKDSQNLKYNAKKGTIHPRYNRVVANLSRAINGYFVKTK